MRWFSCIYSTQCADCWRTVYYVRNVCNAMIRHEKKFTIWKRKERNGKRRTNLRENKNKWNENIDLMCEAKTRCEFQTWTLSWACAGHSGETVSVSFASLVARISWMIVWSLKRAHTHILHWHDDARWYFSHVSFLSHRHYGQFTYRFTINYSAPGCSVAYAPSAQQVLHTKFESFNGCIWNSMLAPSDRSCHFTPVVSKFHWRCAPLHTWAVHWALWAHDEKIRYR